jgi:hypothetical protein
MKNKLLFTLIGGVIIFVWQFMSFALVNFHQSATEYTPAQDEILAKLDELNLEEGMYFLGQPDPSLTMDEQEEVMKKYANKPWATLNYQKEMSMDMAMPMVRSLIIDFIIAFFLFWIFLQQKDANLIKRILLSVAIGFITFLSVPYTNYIWFKEPDIWAYLIDGIIPWAILGFVGHYFARSATIN